MSDRQYALARFLYPQLCAGQYRQVFRTNEASVQLWRGLGFKELAVVPKAGRLKGIQGLVSIKTIIVIEQSYCTVHGSCCLLR